MTVTKDKYVYCSGYYAGRCDCSNLVKYSELEFAFAHWFVPMASDSFLGKDTPQNEIEALQAKRDSIQKRLEATLDMMDDETIAQDVVRSRMTKLTRERDSVDNEIANTKSKQSTNDTLPANIAELDSIIEGVRDNQETRKKVSVIIKTMVDKVTLDLKDKWRPSFKVSLINGETAQFIYEVTDVDFGLNKKGEITATIEDAGYKERKAVAK